MFVYSCSLGFPGGAMVKNPPDKEGAQEMQVRSLGQEDPLEEEDYSTTLAWKIPWTEEPGRLQSFVSPRVGDD